MQTQFDYQVRAISLENLKAMCELISGVCHHYEVEKVTPNRVYVQYSNPDERGRENPMTAVFPCYPSTFDKQANPTVILDMLRVVNDTHGGEGWQCFDPLVDAPKMVRSPEGTWHDTPKG